DSARRRIDRTLQLSERAARDVGKDIDRTVGAGANVIVYYADEAGSRVAHYFKRISLASGRTHRSAPTPGTSVWADTQVRPLRLARQSLWIEPIAHPRTCHEIPGPP